MSSIFRLVNKSGKVAAVGWRHLVNDTALDALEATLQGKSDPQLKKLGVERAQLADAFDLIRQLPRMGDGELMEEDEYYLTSSNYSSTKCYAFPYPTKFRANTTVVPTGPSSAQAIEWWAKAAQVGKAYQMLYDVVDQLSSSPDDEGFEYHIETFADCVKTGQSITRKTFSIEEMGSPAAALTSVQGCVIYLIDGSGQEEGYINRTHAFGSLSSAQVFENLAAAQRYINKMSKHPSFNARDTYTVMEINLSVQAVPVHRQGPPVPSESVLFKVLAEEQAKLLHQEVGQGSDKPPAPRKKKL